MEEATMLVFSRPLAALIVVTLTLSSLGCAHRGPAAAVTTPEAKPDVGTLGLSITPGPYTGWFQRPGIVGAGDGAKAGAAAGAAAPFVPGIFVAKVLGGDLRTAIGALMVLGAGVALAPVGAAVGATVGAIAAPAGDVVERSATALEQALAETDLETLLPAWIMAGAGERPVVLVATPDGPLIDTVLELGAPRVSLESSNPKDWTPALRLGMSLEARLVRASDGEPLRTYAWRHEGPRATFIAWGKDDARTFRAELERAARSLAAQVLADLYEPRKEDAR